MAFLRVDPWAGLMAGTKAASLDNLLVDRMGDLMVESTAVSMAGRKVDPMVETKAD